MEKSFIDINQVHVWGQDDLPRRPCVRLRTNVNEKRKKKGKEKKETALPILETSWPLFFQVWGEKDGKFGYNLELENFSFIAWATLYSPRQYLEAYINMNLSLSPR